MSELDMQAIEARLHNASEGDWRQGLYSFDQSNYMVFGADSKVVAGTTRHTYDNLEGWDDKHSWANANFIAHAKADIAALLAEVKRLSA